ncbi:MAG TPA: VOC family protein [Longimicrobiaceae bacterium]|nr:VOC family protein [Longimicrobiaceae bacterium]
MQVNPYLNFDGQCAEAFRFYAQVLGGTIEAMITHAETPIAGEVPPEWGERIMHARLVVGGQVLMASDSPPEYYQKPQGLYVSVNVDEAAEAERIFHALAEDGTVAMPMAETFWAERFGMCSDRFGTPWMVNCQRPTES